MISLIPNIQPLRAREVRGKPLPKFCELGEGLGWGGFFHQAGRERVLCGLGATLCAQKSGIDNPLERGIIDLNICSIMVNEIAMAVIRLTKPTDLPLVLRPRPNKLPRLRAPRPRPALQPALRPPAPRPAIHNPLPPQEPAYRAGLSTPAPRSQPAGQPLPAPRPATPPAAARSTYAPPDMLRPPPRPAFPAPQPSRPLPAQPPRPAPTPQRPAPTPASRAASPQLADLLSKMNNLPAQTALLGVCDDGLPMLVDLSDAACGALLVLGDEDSRRGEVLHTLVQSAAALNSPRRVQLVILSGDPEPWRERLARGQADRHCLAVEAVQSPEASAWLARVAGWADQRRKRGASGPAVLLVIEDMAVLPDLEYDARVNIDWLIKEGPGVGIWPVLGLEARRAAGLQRWVRLFRTRLFGLPADPGAYASFANGEADRLSGLLDAPGKFAVRPFDEWMSFRSVSNE